MLILTGDSGRVPQRIIGIIIDLWFICNPIRLIFLPMTCELLR